MNEDHIKQLEENAFYESGLSSHGCLEKLDDFAKEAIKTYGRHLLKNYNYQLQEMFKMQVKLVGSLELEKIELEKKLNAAIELADTYYKGLLGIIDSKIETLTNQLKDK